MVPNIGPGDGEPGYEPLTPEERAQAARRAVEEDAWRAIVADLEPQMPAAPETTIPSAPETTNPSAHMTSQPAPDPFIDALLAEPEDFVPPEPPPLRAPSHAVARLAWGALIGGPLLVLLTFVLHLDRLLSTMGIIATIAGFVTLLARLPHTRDSDDDGAIV